MADEQTAFPTALRGYDRAQVDQHIADLQRVLAETRRQLEASDAEAMRLTGQLTEAQRALSETETPTYAGLGSRIEQLLRSAEEQSTDVVTQATERATSIRSSAEGEAERVLARAEREAADPPAARPRRRRRRPTPSPTASAPPRRSPPVSSSTRPSARRAASAPP